MLGMLIDPVIVDPATGKIEKGDLMVENGTVVLGDNTKQVAEVILIANRGEFKEHPLLGAETARELNGNGDPAWPARTRDMLHAAGVMVDRVRIEDNEIILE